jgi:hypothetical protein
MIMDTNTNTDKTLLTCQRCGVINDTVTQTVDPYALEIHGDFVVYTACDNCYDEVSEDI